MKAALGLALTALVAALAACSSSTTDPGGGSSGTSGGSSGSSGGVDAGFDGGFDFVLAGGGTNIQQTDFKVAPVAGSTCQGTNPRRCSFTGSVTIASIGCTFILNVAFVGDVTAGASFSIVADPLTPPGKATGNYTEVCGATTKMWKATGGSVTADVIVPPAQGFATGTMTFSVAAASMGPAANGAGGATGTFSITGKGANVSYISTN